MAQTNRDRDPRESITGRRLGSEWPKGTAPRSRGGEAVRSRYNKPLPSETFDWDYANALFQKNVRELGYYDDEEDSQEPS